MNKYITPCTGPHSPHVVIIKLMNKYKNNLIIIRCDRVKYNYNVIMASKAPSDYKTNLFQVLYINYTSLK